MTEYARIAVTTLPTAWGDPIAQRFTVTVNRIGPDEPVWPAAFRGEYTTLADAEDSIARGGYTTTKTWADAARREGVTKVRGTEGTYYRQEIAS